MEFRRPADLSGDHDSSMSDNITFVVPYVVRIVLMVPQNQPQSTRRLAIKNT